MSMTATADRVPTEDERLLTRADAEALLRSLGRTVKRVHRVCDDDAVLFVGAFGRLYTAWLSREDGRIAAVQYEEGWSARPGSCSRVSNPQPIDPPTSGDDPDGA